VTAIAAEISEGSRNQALNVQKVHNLLKDVHQSSRQIQKISDDTALMAEKLDRDSSGLVAQLNLRMQQDDACVLREDCRATGDAGQDRHLWTDPSLVSMQPAPAGLAA